MILALQAASPSAGAGKPTDTQKCRIALASAEELYALVPLSPYLDPIKTRPRRVEFLVTIGYDPRVAEQIVFRKPRLFTEIWTHFVRDTQAHLLRTQQIQKVRKDLPASWLRERYESFLLDLAPDEAYRGISVEPGHYNPKLKNSEHLSRGEKFVSNDFGLAHSYAVGTYYSEAVIGGMSREEARRYLSDLRKNGIRHFGIVLEYQFPKSVGVRRITRLNAAEFSDDSIFIKQIGVLDISKSPLRAVDGLTYEWMSYEEFVRRYH